MNKLVATFLVFLFMASSPVYAVTKANYENTRDKLAIEIHQNLIKNLTKKQVEIFGPDLYGSINISLTSLRAADVILNQPGIALPLTAPQLIDSAKFGISKSITWKKIDGFSAPVSISNQTMVEELDKHNVTYFFWLKLEGSENTVYMAYSDCKSPLKMGWTASYIGKKDSSDWTMHMGSGVVEIYKSDSAFGYATKLACANKAKAQQWPYIQHVR